jgi:ACR3 family arsenite transporter
MPGLFQTVAALEVAHVNLVVAVFIWIMIYPMMVQIDWSAVRNVGRRPRGLALTLLVNWLIKPFTMAALGVFFFEFVFAGWVSPADAQQYIAGMILLGVAPCTAMVFVWSQLVRGDPNYTLVQVSVNDLIMVVAFAPIAAFLLGVTELTVPWTTLVLATVLYVVLLFGLQAPTLVAQPFVIALIAVPLVLQSYGVFALSWVGARWLKLPHDIAGPACLIGTSNFFELAVAVAISLFGLHSGAALATVVGVLVEVPVMLSLVWWVNRDRTHEV